jgi:hypothetical protein
MNHDRGHASDADGLGSGGRQVPGLRLRTRSDAVNPAWMTSVLPEDWDPPTETVNGTNFWRNSKGELHRLRDRPAILGPDRREWHVDGLSHRDHDQPAKIDGELREWWVHGRCHRDGDLPAIINTERRGLWYRDGLLHREGGKPAVIGPGRCLEWWVDGLRHRLNGLPAFIDGST